MATITTRSVANGVEITDGTSTIVVPREQVSTIAPALQVKADTLASARAALDAVLNNARSSDVELTEAWNRYMRAFYFKP